MKVKIFLMYLGDRIFWKNLCILSYLFLRSITKLKSFYLLRSIGTLNTLNFLRSNTTQLSKSPNINTTQNISVNTAGKSET